MWHRGQVEEDVLQDWFKKANRGSHQEKGSMEKAHQKGGQGKSGICLNYGKLSTLCVNARRERPYFLATMVHF